MNKENITVLVGLNKEDLELLKLALEMACNFYSSVYLPLMKEKMKNQLNKINDALKEISA